MDLQEFFRSHPKAAVAFSGGADSAYLLWAAKQYGRQVAAYYAKTPFQPDWEWSGAKSLAAQLGVPLTEVAVNVLSVDAIRKNPENRCYFCKKAMFSALMEKAREDGFDLLLEGTNGSDDVDDRPGFAALQELGVLSPLRLCGLTKAQIRERTLQAGLPTWDKPAYACLATRIPTGREITLSDLRRTEEGETILKTMGFSDFRIRLVGETAKLQLREEQLPLLLARRQDILEQLKPLYDAVLLDLEVRP